MIRVSFFCKEIHAGAIIIALDKIAIDLAMTPVKASSEGTAARKSKSGHGSKKAAALRILQTNGITSPFTPPELAHAMSQAGHGIANIHGFLKSLIKSGHVRKTAKGYIVKDKT